MRRRSVSPAVDSELAALTDLNFCIDDPETVRSTLRFLADVLSEVARDTGFLDQLKVSYKGKILEFYRNYAILAAILQVREELGNGASKEALEGAILGCLIRHIREQCAEILVKDTALSESLDGLSGIYSVSSETKVGDLLSVEGLDDYTESESGQNQTWLAAARKPLAEYDGFLALVQVLAEAPRPLSVAELCKRIPDPDETMEEGDLYALVNTFLGRNFQLTFTIASQNLNGVLYYQLAPALG